MQMVGVEKSRILYDIQTNSFEVYDHLTVVLGQDNMSLVSRNSVSVFGPEIPGQLAAALGCLARPI
jgi:hypothetical protein